MSKKGGTTDFSDDMNPKKETDKAKKAAEEYASNKEKTEHLLDEAFEKAERAKGSLKKIWDDLMSLFKMVRAWAKGEYQEVPWQTIILAIAGIIYFVNPFDVVPDFLPGVGYLDDATVIAFVIKFIRDDVERFKTWQGSGESESTT